MPGRYINHFQLTVQNSTSKNIQSTFGLHHQLIQMLNPLKSYDSPKKCVYDSNRKTELTLCKLRYRKSVKIY